MWCADVRRAARHTIVRRTICAPCRRNTFLGARNLAAGTSWDRNTFLRVRSRWRQRAAGDTHFKKLLLALPANVLKGVFQSSQRSSRSAQMTGS